MSKKVITYQLQKYPFRGGAIAVSDSVLKLKRFAAKDAGDEPVKWSKSESLGDYCGTVVNLEFRGQMYSISTVKRV